MITIPQVDRVMNKILLTEAARSRREHRSMESLIPIDNGGSYR